MIKKRVGILGGGQLGRMLNEAASTMALQVIILDPSEDAPAGQFGNKNGHLVGSFQDVEKISALAQQVDVITYEIEHIHADAVADIIQKQKQRGNGVSVEAQPAPATIRLIQDKYQQKLYLHERGIPVPEFMDAPTQKSIEEAGARYGYPLMLKSKTLAYDGKGNAVVRSAAEIPVAMKALGGGQEKGGPSLYVEAWVPYTKELAVMVAKGAHGQLSVYPVVETIQKHSICHLVIAPADVDSKVTEMALNLAKEAISHLEGYGVFGVELFLTNDGTVLLNEIAPRPHNSGHYTIEACYTSQFEQHLRAVVGLPLGCPDMKVPSSVMLNIVGEEDGAAGLEKCFALCSKAWTLPGATVHWYGKKDCRKGRKMGHITVTGTDPESVFKHVNDLLGAEEQQLLPAHQRQRAPQVAVIMGSDSDLGVMKQCAEILEQFHVPFEISIVSAHRTPERMLEFASNAHKRGVRVIVAAAGGAAHLPGMVAAITPLPVVGVPIALKHLDGVDSLHSIVQMPRGIPVATVAINNSTNAALLAIRILGSHEPKYLQALLDHQKSMKDAVLEKVENLDRVGWKAYVKTD